MSTLLVGFDAAWTATNAGALVGAVTDGSGAVQSVGAPISVGYTAAESTIKRWQSEYHPDRTLVLLDQPTIVPNASGQRPVEHLVCSPVSRRYGGMQPAYTRKTSMFGSDAPIWSFLTHFGGAAPPSDALSGSRVVETYPVLTLIALGWLWPDTRPGGRLPKYNPQVRRKFSLADWQRLCRQTAGALQAHRVGTVAEWLTGVADNPKPRKADQDALDACICLLVALHMAAGQDCLMVGNDRTGYILVPHSEPLAEELKRRCHSTGREPHAWIKVLRGV